MKIYQTAKEPAAVSEPVGTVLTDGRTYLKVALADGYLHIESLQLAGKKRMAVADFLRGLQAGTELHVN